MTKAALCYFPLGWFEGGGVTGSRGLEAHGHLIYNNFLSFLLVHKANNYPFFSLEKQWEIPGKRYHQLSTIGQAYS